MKVKTYKHKDIDYTCTQLAELAGCCHATMKRRLQTMTVNKALNEPSGNQAIAKYTYKGEQYSVGGLAALAAEGVTAPLIAARLSAGWTPNDSVETPVIKPTQWRDKPIKKTTIKI